MAALGAAPLADDDPLRDELSRLVAPGDSVEAPRSARRGHRPKPRLGTLEHAGPAGRRHLHPPRPRGARGRRQLHAGRRDPGPAGHPAAAPGGRVDHRQPRGAADRSGRHDGHRGGARDRDGHRHLQGRHRPAPGRGLARRGPTRSTSSRWTSRSRWATRSASRPPPGTSAAGRSSRPITWRSADPSVAAVTPHGSIAGQAPGTVRLTCSSTTPSEHRDPGAAAQGGGGGHRRGARVGARSGGTFLLTATALDRRNQPLVRRGILWTSSDGAVAVVTAEGWVAALRPGTVVLTASCEGARASVHVAVTARPAVPSPVPAPAPRTEPVLRRRSRRSRRRRLAGAVLGALAIGAGAWGWLRLAPDGAPETAAVRPNPAAVRAWPMPTPRRRCPRRHRAIGRPRPRPVPSPRTSRRGRPSPPSPSSPRPRSGSRQLALRAVALGAAGDTLAGVPMPGGRAATRVILRSMRSGLVRGLAPGTGDTGARRRRSAFAELTVLPAAVAALQVLGARPMAVREMLALHIRARDSWGGRWTADWSPGPAPTRAWPRWTRARASSPPALRG